MTATFYDPAAWLARRLPGALAYAFARAGGRVAFSLSAVRRQAVLSNLLRVLPAASPVERSRIAKKTFESFAESLVDSWRDKARGSITIDGEEHVIAALERGHGVLVWSAHVGNWELAGAALAQRGYDVAAVAREHGDRAVERWFERARSRAGVRVVARCPGAFEARRVLRERGLLALLGDRRFGQGGRAVALFGRTARLPAAPLALARRTGAVLVPGFVVRESRGRYRIRFEPPIIASPERALERLAATLEGWVRAHPEQWFMFEPMWDDARTDRA